MRKTRSVPVTRVPCPVKKCRPASQREPQLFAGVCEPGCFAQRVRNLLIAKGLTNRTVQKSAS